MCIIVLKTKKCVMDEVLLSLDVAPRGEDDFAWVDTCIRTADIKDFYKKSDAKFIITYYDGREDSIVKGCFEDFVKDFSYLEYDKIIDDSQ